MRWASVVLIAFLLGVLLLVAFDLFCLVHLAAADRMRFLPKLAWAAVIVCVSPIGGAVYLLCQRQPDRSPDPPRSRAPSHATGASSAHAG